MFHVCFVCLGNICRSPTAEGIFIDMIQRAGLTDQIAIDSAGTGSWHIGANADPRSIEAASRHNIELGSKARQFVASDLKRFDLIIAMDHQNLRDLRAMTRDASLAAKIHLLRSFSPNSDGDLDVPDPYYCGDQGFEQVFQICQQSLSGLLTYIKQQNWIV